MRKLSVALALWLLALGPAWASSVFDLGLLNPSASQLVHYPEVPGGQNGLQSDFTFSIGSGDWVKMEFQGFPSAQTGFSTIEYILRDKDWNKFGSGFLSLDGSNYWTTTRSGLSAGTNYTFNIYGWGDPMGGGDGGDYRITLSADQGGPSIPEPGSLALVILAVVAAGAARKVSRTQGNAARARLPLR